MSGPSSFIHKALYNKQFYQARELSAIHKSESPDRQRVANEWCDDRRIYSV